MLTGDDGIHDGIADGGDGALVYVTDEMQVVHASGHFL